MTLLNSLMIKSLHFLRTMMHPRLLPFAIDILHLKCPGKLSLNGPYSPGQELRLKFTIQTDYQDDDLKVPSPHYPIRRFESWWILISDAHSSTLCSIKRVTMTMPIVECLVDLEIPVETGETWNGKIFVVCDSFAGADQEHELVLSIEA